ncbi:MAG: hypothetical protein Q8R40_00275 [bacterium]|nr:hypothetical protein [bacterium]
MPSRSEESLSRTKKGILQIQIDKEKEVTERNLERVQLDNEITSLSRQFLEDCYQKIDQASDSGLRSVKVAADQKRTIIAGLHQKYQRLHYKEFDDAFDSFLERVVILLANNENRYQVSAKSYLEHYTHDDMPCQARRWYMQIDW